MLSVEEFRQKGEEAVQEIKKYCSDLSLWNPVSSKDGIEVFTRPGIATKDCEDMFLLITTLPCTMEKFEKLMAPWLGYRMTWDKMLENVEILDKWCEDEVYLVRHLVKKLYTLSARDSIDIVKVLRHDNEIIMGSTSVVLDNHPPTKEYVRTIQHLGGYMLRPSDSDPNHTKVYMLFHADLNLPGPRFVSNIASKFKPKLMKEKIENLKSAIEKIDI